MNPIAQPLRTSRREWLQTLGGGFSSIALAGLCAEEAAYQSPLAARASHFAARAKRIIFMCMRGGPSHLETFDYKPQLNADNLKPGRNPKSKLFGSQWKFTQHGRSGLWMSSLFPNLATQADRLCMIHSMHTDNENHPQALEQLHTGSFQFIRPSLGSWVAYGLGTENRNLPGFVALNPLSALGGSRYYSSAFLPASFAATRIGDSGKPIARATMGNLASPRLAPEGQRRQLDLLQTMNQETARQQTHDGRLEGVIESLNSRSACRASCLRSWTCPARPRQPGSFTALAKGC